MGQVAFSNACSKEGSKASVRVECISGTLTRTGVTEQRECNRKSKASAWLQTCNQRLFRCERSTDVYSNKGQAREFHRQNHRHCTGWRLSSLPHLVLWPNVRFRLGSAD